MYLRDRAGKDGSCYPAVSTIAQDLKMSKSTVKGAMPAEKLYHRILKRKTEELLQKLDRITAALILVIVPLAAVDSHAVMRSAAVRVNILIRRADFFHPTAVMDRFIMSLQC